MVYIVSALSAIWKLICQCFSLLALYFFGDLYAMCPSWETGPTKTDIFAMTLPVVVVALQVIMFAISADDAKKKKTVLLGF